jgi:hypothetical protein
MSSWSDALSGLFKGSPQQAPSYTTTTSDVPKWLQDYTVDLFSQQRAVSALPYQTYQLPRIAQEQAETQQSRELVANQVGAWQNPTNAALAGTQGLASGNAGVTGGMGMMGDATNYSAVGAASPFINQAAGMSGLSAAIPYITNAAQSCASNVQNYMNPYNQAVTDQIAKMGARNLTENLLPNVSDQFIRAGQFGSSRMGEFGGRALRDTQESILDRQQQALQQGYTQALGASQADLGRLAQIGSTAGSLAGQQQQALASMGSQLGNLTSQEQQNLANIGAQYGSLGLQGGAQQLSALGQMSDIAKMQQGLSTADAAALQSVGAERQALQQRGFDLAYQDFLDQRNFPQQQVNAMSTTLRGLPPAAIPTAGTQGGYTTQFAASPLSQVASAFSLGQGINRLTGGT